MHFHLLPLGISKSPRPSI